NVPIVGMKTCIAGAPGVNTNTFRKARETRLGHAIEPRPETTRNRRNGEFSLPQATWVVPTFQPVVPRRGVRTHPAPGARSPGRAATGRCQVAASADRADPEAVLESMRGVASW